MKILSIGNSFSQDAQRYLHALAAQEGESLTCVNLYIGGCSLKTHWENAEDDKPLYSYERNGAPVFLDGEGGRPRYCSIRAALEEGGWDAVTLQQCSHDSGKYETYQPYLTRLSGYVRQYAPQAKQWLHQTWAYETDSTHSAFPDYGRSQQAMYQRLKAAYALASASIGAPLIPAGDMIQALRALPAFDYAHGGPSLCRDGFHMSLTLGRYALAAVWYAALTGKAPQADFVPEGSQPGDDARRALIRRTAAQLVLPERGAR